MDAAFCNLMIIGVFVYGALGLAGLIATALVTGNKTAALFAIAACGFAYGAQHAGALAASRWSYGLDRINFFATMLAVGFAVLSFVILLSRT